MKDVLKIALVSAVVMTLLQGIPIVMAGLQGTPAVWDADWEDDPDNTDAIGQGDDHMRDMREEIRERLETEHRFGAFITADDDGRHREGAARAFFDGTEPPTIPATDYFNGTTGAADAALDQGRLWHDSDVDNGTFKIHDGTNFVEAVTAMSGDPNNRINLLSGVQFMLASSQANQINIHDHDTRHGSVSALDPIAFLINAVLTSSVVAGAIEVPNNATTTLLTATDFLAFNGRTGNSRVLLIGKVGGGTAAGIAGLSNVRIDLHFFDDTTSLQVGTSSVFHWARISDNSSGSHTILAYYTGVTAVDHTILIRATSTLSDSHWNAVNIFIIALDLGLE